MIFGKRPEIMCKISCNGQGPIILVDRNKINFGQITLLQTITTDLLISNDSPIPANLHLSTVILCL